MLLLVFVAQADLPPPVGYVEQCTLAKAGKGCVACSGWHGGREECEALEARGYAKHCQTRGASTWTEILCPGPDGPTSPPIVAEVDPPVIAEVEPPAPTPAPPPAETPKSESRCDSVGAPVAIGLLPLLALALRRRR